MSNNNNNNDITFDEVYAYMLSLRTNNETMTYIHEAEEDEDVSLLLSRKRKRSEDEDIVKASIIALRQLIIRRTINTLQLINYDVFYSIYVGSFVHLEATSIRRRNPVTGGETTWWSITHPNLLDTPEYNDYGRVVRESTFKEHYRINLNTFEILVNLLSATEEFRGSALSAHAWPVWKQVAIVLWRFSNTHFGYRMAKDKFGCSHGCYNDFTNRFVKAMSTTLLKKIIVWPNTVSSTRRIANGFANPTEDGDEHLEDVIGAMDGKLILIEKPTFQNQGNRYADRKSHISMGLMAVCDHKKRFISIATGTPGTFKVYLLWRQ